jgi:hypothetical protein
MIADRIRQARLAAGLTLGALGGQVGLEMAGGADAARDPA